MDNIDDARILTINPGSTSTKFGVFAGLEALFIKTIRHTNEELDPFEKITDQFEFRKDLILKQVEQEDIDIRSIRAVVGRGGLLKPVESGACMPLMKLCYET